MNSPNFPAPINTNTRLTGFRKWALRALWLLAAVPLLVLEVAMAGPYLDSLQTICIETVESCGNQLTAADAASLAAEGVSLGGYVLWFGGVALLSLLVWQGVGVLLFILRSDDWMAALASLFLIVFSGATFSSDLLVYAAVVYPQLAPAMMGLDVLGEVLVTAFFLLFPNGRLVPRWLWWLLILRPIVTVLDYLPGIGINEMLSALLFMVPIALLVLAQVYRYRRVSTPFEKEQTRWVIFGATFGVGTLLLITSLAITSGTWSGGLTRNGLITLAVMTLAMSAIPITIAVAMLRSRLWDIDVVIRKTTAYAILTGVLTILYLGSIVVLQRLLSPVTGESNVAVVLSTLLIAALFLPLRRRVQDAIDRRFFRSKYDAEQVLASFAATVRDETDLDALTAELVRVIQETMQPEFVSVWLKPVGTNEPDKTIQR
jgi:hypothetical protein